MSPLQILLLGPPEVRLGPQLLAFPTRKTLALLVYLALEPGPQPRERLAAMFWPGSSVKRSYGSLRNTLNHLLTTWRKASGQHHHAYLTIAHQTLGLDPDALIEFDLQTVDRAYAIARADRSSRAVPEGSASVPALQAAVACYRGDFLAGFSLGDAPIFDEWVGIQREAWRRRLGLILDRLSEIQYGLGELADTAETTSQWIALDGLNEIAYRRKMRAHFAAGERGQALETYETCRSLLASELGIEPEPDTEALAARIRSRHVPQAPKLKQATPQTAAGFLEVLFAGRNAEQQSLNKGFAAAAEGQMQIVLVSGEAGIGKTRLARTFLDSAIAQGAGVLQGGAFESGRGIPFQPWIEALRAELERDDAPTDWLRGATWLSPLAELIPGLREKSATGPLRLRSAESPAGQSRIFEALARFTLAQADRAPLIVFFDDLQWADSATLDALHYAMRRWQAQRARVMLLVSLRTAVMPMFGSAHPPGLNSWLMDVEHEWKAIHLELEPLNDRETVTMLRDLLEPPAPDFAQWTYNETGGHPFYVMETLKDLLERGALHPHRHPSGKWTFEIDSRHDLGQSVRVPSTVRAVIRSRLNRLSPAAFTLLAAGTVLEHALTFERLCSVANLPPDVGLSALDEVLSGRLLRDIEIPGSAGAFAFANDMLRDVVYTEAGDARRRLFHRRALDLLEAEHDSAAALAHHAMAAGAAQEALRHSLAAGQEALRVGAPGEAHAHLDNARQLAREASAANAEVEARLRSLYAQLGQAYSQNGQPDLAARIGTEQARSKSSGPGSTP